MVSDQYVHKLFERYIDAQVLNIKEDEFMPSFVEIEDRHFFPTVENTLKEQAKLMTSKSSKELKAILTQKFSGFRALTKGKMATLYRKLRSAELAISMDETKTESITHDVNQLVQKFFTQSTQKTEEEVAEQPVDKYGSTNFQMYQVSPMLETVLKRDTYKKIKQGKRQLFGVCSNNIVEGSTIKELGEKFEIIKENNKAEKKNEQGDKEKIVGAAIGFFMKKKGDLDPWERIEKMHTGNSKQMQRLEDVFEAKRRIMIDIDKEVDKYPQSFAADYEYKNNILNQLYPERNQPKPSPIVELNASYSQILRELGTHRTNKSLKTNTTNNDNSRGQLLLDELPVIEIINSMTSPAHATFPTQIQGRRGAASSPPLALEPTVSGISPISENTRQFSFNGKQLPPIGDGKGKNSIANPSQINSNSQNSKPEKNFTQQLKVLAMKNVVLQEGISKERPHKKSIKGLSVGNTPQSIAENLKFSKKNSQMSVSHQNSQSNLELSNKKITESKPSNPEVIQVNPTPEFLVARPSTRDSTQLRVLMQKERSQHRTPVQRLPNSRKSSTSSSEADSRRTKPSHPSLQPNLPTIILAPLNPPSQNRKYSISH